MKIGKTLGVLINYGRILLSIAVALAFFWTVITVVPLEGGVRALPFWEAVLLFLGGSCVAIVMALCWKGLG